MPPFPAFLPSPSRLPQLGLDISGDHLRLAVLDPRRPWRLAEQRSAVPLCQHGQFGDLELLIHSCRALLARHGIRRGRLHLGLPAAATASWTLVLPATSPDQARLAQVQADCALRLGAHAAQSVLDFRVIGPVPHSPQDVVLDVACAPTLLVEDRLALAAALGLRSGCILLQEASTRRWLGADRDDVALLQLDAQQSWLAYRQRLLPLDWQADQALSALLLALAPALGPALQPPPAQLWLTGALAVRPDLAPALRRYTGIATRVATPAAWPGDACPPAFHGALALAASARA